MKLFSAALLLALGLGSVQAQDVSFSFPPTDSSQFVHGLCAMGASSVSATCSDPSVSYSTHPEPFGNGVNVWGDRNYVTQGVSGPEMCEGGTYLAPTKHKHVAKGSHIVLTATPNPGEEVTICAFVETGSRDGEWDVSLPASGFSKSDSFKWTNGGVTGGFESYCKTFAPGTNEAPAEPVYGTCANGTLASNGHFYEVVQYKKGTKTWHEAKAEAEQKTYCGKKGHLVTMTFKEESDFVVDLIRADTCGSSHDTWIGLRDDRQEGTFEWVTGEPYDWDHWCPGQPDNGGNEDFGEIWIDGNNDGCWNDNQADTNGSANGADNDKFVVEYACDPVAPDAEDRTPTTTDMAYTKGDPHFKTFGGEMYDFHGECDLVLLHNPDFAKKLGMDIHIRTKIESFWSSIESAVLKIGDETMEITANPNTKEWLWFGGKEVTTSLESGKWERNQLGGFLVRYKESQGPDGLIREAIFYPTPHAHKEHMTFKAYKNFLRIDVDWKDSDNYVNSVGLLGAHARGGERLGRDGRFIRDVNAFGLDWQVIPEVDGSLFHSYEGAVVNQKCLMPANYEPTVSALRRRLGASAMEESVAETACNHLVDPDEKKACVYDVIATQDLGMASTW